MVKHVILWKLDKNLSKTEKENIKLGIKNGLESLKGKIPGLLDITVVTACLASSNADVMLDSCFESEAALKAYASHPDHVAVADTHVRPYTTDRICMDYVCEG